MKKLVTFAFVAALLVGVSGASASLAQEGKQNFYYYFGAKCPCPMTSGYGTCGPVCPVDPCCERGFFEGLLY
ncbi:MAG: hypothetical protein ACD_16C00044G0003 [uncultured bacterium]|nr:MAG: hypothetical protein ACD_16C00044G0003 [uncultured bacterium]OFW68399.1 MAG: hypothetical protein A2X70_06840 [Alphaproteobacteria bacterium GWC2_42_16]OFW73033.1 MAG: hypothetical protein A2Z80_07335 [Alphaproteobacteria bacterium GWA2_41_27]OFW81491.1 MAG: hypothetical protein A3E50_05810 [Alphaproteobacteria bacterium RIFCSPHIGHO2_12_FULL_42_100]OFW85250.1 MAG: hypothetical protein A2W06_07535 [Alphaproteobacteria bacterium RBG_16_42_14]OFW91085.1 MAG: hypothetical protein A2W46_057